MSNVDTTCIFKERPKPCAGDMRISWRLSIILLSLLHSRGKKASFSKLHVLNNALCSKVSQDDIKLIIENKIPSYTWQLRIEPAFTRALDFVVGEGFADWSVSSKRTTLALTDKGIKAAEQLERCNEVLIYERDFLSGLANQITETFVQRMLIEGKHLL